MKSFYKITVVTACLCIILGGIIAIVGLVNGGAIVHNYFSDYTATDFSEEYENVSQIEFNIAAADVEIVTEAGSKFKIEATSVPKELFYSKVENGKWTIGYDKKYGGWFNIFSWGDIDLNSKIKIILPEDHSLESAIIDAGAAKITIASLSAREVKLDIGAGDLQVNKLDTNSLDIDTGAGQAIVKGSVKGDIRIDCGVGNVELILTGGQNDFNYDIDVGVGKVTIGNNDLAGITDKKINNNSDYDVKIDCGIGNVSIKFNGEEEK